MENVDYGLIDFGYRGCTSEEQAAIGGAAHLLSFKGTDNIAGIRMLQYYYNAPMCGFSVPATEHSVMVAGLKENEIQTYKNILKLYPEGIVSIVSDTWDVYNVCRFLSTDPELKEMILNRNGKLVIRPDSGDIAEVLLKCLDILAEGFGYTTHTKEYTNPKTGEVKTKEYKTINSKLGLLQGDGIDIYTMQKYLSILEQKGWSMDNLVWGSGGGLLQKVNRDTIKAAIKASYIEINGVGRDIQKDPITAQGSKKSKAGKQYLLKSKDGYRTTSHNDDLKDEEIYALDTVYQDGKLLIETTYNDIQNTIKEEMTFHSNAIIEEIV